MSTSDGVAGLATGGLIQPLEQLLGWDMKDIAYPQEGGEGYGTTYLDLLPVPSREAEGNHVLLAVAALLPRIPHPMPKQTKELLLISHLQP